MPRKKTRKTLKRELMLLAKNHIKERDNYTCRRCSRQVYGTNCHASHIIPVSADGRLSYEPLNMIVLCYRCHVWWHEEPCESGMWYRSTYPDNWRYLSAMRQENASKGTIPLQWFHEAIKWFEEAAVDEPTEGSSEARTEGSETTPA